MSPEVAPSRDSARRDRAIGLTKVNRPPYISTKAGRNASTSQPASAAPAS